METQSGNPTIKTQAQLVRHEDDAVMIYIGDAPIEVRTARMPGTFNKLAAMIERANETTEKGR
jgi:hypothetical protein